MQRFLGILLFFIFIVGCKSDRPKYVIKEEEMTKLLLDLHIADGFIYTEASDTIRMKSSDYIEGVYKHYNTDSVTVRKSLEYYARHPQILNTIYQEIQKHLHTMEADLQKIEAAKDHAIFVADSIRTAFVADSLLKIQIDSTRYYDSRYMLYWKSPDSTDLKPKAWEWKKEAIPPKRYFNYTDSMFFVDTTRLKDSIINKTSLVKDSIDAKKSANLKKDSTIKKKQAFKNESLKSIFKRKSIAEKKPVEDKTGK